LGDFEHSLMFYHRGQRLRPEQAAFRLGVQKAQEAIENAIGSKKKYLRIFQTSHFLQNRLQRKFSSVVLKRAGKF